MDKHILAIVDFAGSEWEASEESCYSEEIWSARVL